nr:MAG TPA: hypothetical protein [Caudoviricetes sp.]
MFNVLYISYLLGLTLENRISKGFSSRLLYSIKNNLFYNSHRDFVFDIAKIINNT